VQDSLVHRWSSGDLEQAHFRKIVIGPAPSSTGTAGPWAADLSALSIDRLASVDPASIAGAPAGLSLSGDSLAETLRGLPSSARTALWQALVAATGSDQSGGYDGNLGFVSKDGVAADVSSAVFDENVKSGDVVGPISTPSGPELFLVKAHYPDLLDDRARIALDQVISDPSPNPAAYTERFSPTEAPLASDAGWRAQAEFSSEEPAEKALFDTPVGSLSDPFVLDGKLALAIVDERRTGPPDARMLARLTLDGFQPWFGAELAKATISRNPNPLPELLTSASPSASPTASPTGAIELPSLPTMPGIAAPTPVKTNEFGVPVVP
jgi:hypothetical protein